MEDKKAGQQGPGEDVRQRKHLTPEDKLQIYREYVAAKAGNHGAVGELLRKWGIHSSELKRLTETVEGGALQEFKERKSRRPRVSAEEVEKLRADNARLERTIVEQAMEIGVLKKNLRPGCRTT